MKNLLTQFCTGTILAISMAACSSDESLLSVTDNNAITFTSMVTKASETRWDTGDRIGVFMKAHSAEWDNATLTGSSANISYTTLNGDGTFTASSAPLKYPQSSITYDFTAYYPWSSSITDGIYKVDVSNQSNPAAIDLLYADNLKNIPASSTANPLSFSHKLASVVLKIKSADGKDISGLKATISGVPATADFNVKDGSFTNVAAATSDIHMYTTGQGTSLTATAFLIPVKSLTQSGLQVKLASADGNTSKTVTLQDGANALINSLESGKIYTVNINVKNIGSTIQQPAASYIRWIETPTITDAQLKDAKLQYVNHFFTDGGKKVRNYSMLYNKDLKVAYWVAYPLNTYYTKKTTGRTDTWGYDPQVSENDQVNLGKKSSGLAESSKYDRGHQIPSNDRTGSVEANNQTFYYTNMTPQVGEMNKNIWRLLETAVNGWSSNVDTLYVVTGAGFNSTTSIKYTGIKNSSAKIAVPDYYYKAVLKIVDRKTGEARAIAFKLNNEKYSDQDYMKYAISVSDLEKLTGFTFFPDIDEKYKATFDKTKWQ